MNFAKALEARKTFNEAVNMGNMAAMNRLTEAMSTSDFPSLLGQGFEIEMLDIFKETPREWEGLVYKTVLPDFNPKKLGAILDGTTLLPVNEGEEYKAQGVNEQIADIKVAKYGRRRQFTFELQMNRDFTSLLNIPRDFASGAVDAENTAVYSALLNGKGGFNTGFFKDAAKPTNTALTAENLQAAYESLATRKGVSGKTADVSDLYLVVHPAKLFTANRIVNSEYIETTVGNVKTTEKNPFRGFVKVIAPQTLADQGLDPAAWFLLPGAKSKNPALAIAFLQGHENPDIRVKNDQGNSVGGGNIAPEEGSYIDDTIDYRVRHIIGGTVLFNHAAFASAGK